MTNSADVRALPIAQGRVDGSVLGTGALLALPVSSVWRVDHPRLYSPQTADIANVLMATRARSRVLAELGRQY